MVSLRKASSYSRKPARPYTRVSRNKSKAYIKQVPNNKVVRYIFGNIEAHNSGKLKYRVRLIAREGAQIRDNAIESSRMLLIKVLDQEAPKQYYFAIKIYPHHILRNNKTAAGAGADRLSSGMRHSFGIIEGRAAVVHPGKELFYIACENEKAAKIAREAMTKVKSKLPCRSVIRFERLQV